MRIPQSSPTWVLIHRFSAWRWESRRDPVFSKSYGRMWQQTVVAATLRVILWWLLVYVSILLQPGGSIEASLAYYKPLVFEFRVSLSDWEEANLWEGQFKFWKPHPSSQLPLEGYIRASLSVHSVDGRGSSSKLQLLLRPSICQQAVYHGQLIGPYQHFKKLLCFSWSLKVYVRWWSDLDTLFYLEIVWGYISHVMRHPPSSLQTCERCEHIFKLYLPRYIVPILRLMFPIALKQRLPSSLIVNIDKHASTRTKYLQTKLLAAKLVWIEISSHTRVVMLCQTLFLQITYHSRESRRLQPHYWW